MSTDAPEPTSESSAPALPGKNKRSRTPWIAGVIALVVVLVGGGVFLSARGDDTKTVRIGVPDASQPYWKTYTKLAKDRLGIDVKIQNFTDYSQPNPALKEKQLDINEFQHVQYLANYNVTAKDDLQPIGATAIYPLPLYATKYDSVKKVPSGAKVAVPNDAINEARGLLVLQAAGLLTLKDGGTAFSSTKDIETKKVNVVTLDASQTANALKTGSVAAAIVNQNYAKPAGLKKSQVLFQDSPNSESAAPYVNIFVTRKADADNKEYRKLAALYLDPTVEKQVQEANDNSAYFRKFTAAQLQTLLTKVEKDAKAANN